MEYHLREAEIARSAGDKRRILPIVPVGARRVLDIGCGAGQTLLALDLQGITAVGADLDREALGLGRKLSGKFHFVQSQGETLPFGEGCFDLVFSRVAVPYMDIPMALREMARVLRPGGSLWITLHPLWMLSWSAALASPKAFAFEMYRLVNTGWFTVSGSVFRYPLRRSRLESYQTERGMRLALREAGFEGVGFQHEGHFLATAQKARRA
jgi:SAM-dependent methyltransferase